MPIRMARIRNVLLFFKLWPSQIIFTPVITGLFKGKAYTELGTFKKTWFIVVGNNCTVHIERQFD